MKCGIMGIPVFDIKQELMWHHLLGTVCVFVSQCLQNNLIPPVDLAGQDQTSESHGLVSISCIKAFIPKPDSCYVIPRFRHIPNLDKRRIVSFRTRSSVWIV